MSSHLHQLTLVKRYLWGSLAIAIIPLIIVAILYDSHSSSLTSRLLLEKIEGDIQVTVVKIENFIDIQAKRLNDLADLQEIDVIFTRNNTQVFSDQLLDFLYLETGDQDVYSIEFYDNGGQFLWSLPASTGHVNSNEVIGFDNDSIQVSDPVLPVSGRPGWFYMYKPVIRKDGKIGTIALKIRLSSLTEKTAALYRPDIHEPIIFTPLDEALNVVGQIVTPHDLLTESRQFLPSWSIGLQQSGELVGETGIRVWLLFFVVLSAISVVGLYFSMSRRLANWLLPLKDGAKAIADGNLDVKVSEDGPGELGTLGRSFNHMSMQLRSMITSRVDLERQATLGNLATGIAHEIRNPLATIGTTLHGLIVSEKDIERKLMMEAMDDEIIRTDGIVEEFMNYARPREPRMERIAIKDVFNHVKVLVSSTALDSGVEISLLGQRSIIIYADSGQLRQVLMNIIFNALQAMPDGGTLRLKAIENNGYAEITATDNGIGIDAEVLSKVQKPFFTTKKGGTGLGLAICAQLIKVNRGTFDIESKLNVGTTIKITLPIVPTISAGTK